MPELPPVTIATFPCSPFITPSLELSCGQCVLEASPLHLGPDVTVCPPVGSRDGTIGRGDDMNFDNLVAVLAIAAAVPLVLAFVPRLPVPGPVLEIVAGILLGPAVLDVVQPD